MPNLKGRIDEFLLASRILIENSLSHPDILSKVAEYGYDEERFKEAQALHLEVTELHNLQKKEYGEQYEATGALDEAFKKADGAYMKSLKVARVAFQNNPKAGSQGWGHHPRG